MSEHQQQVAPAPKYPNSFLFGVASGFTASAWARYYQGEPVSARPLTYLKTMIGFGVIMWQWDYFRRNALENVLEGEDKMKYYTTMQAINHNLRVGDEDEITNLTEYLAGSTTRA